MARERPTASDGAPPKLDCLDGGKPDCDDPPLLTRAETRALRRSDRLTQADLERHLEGLGDPPPRSA